MKKSIFTMITLLVISLSSVSAQTVWGIRVGATKPTLNVSTSVDKVSASTNHEGKFGVEIGPTIYRGLGNNFYLNSGLMFSINNLEDGVGHEFNIDYLDLSLNVGYAFPLGSVQPYVQAGGYSGYKVYASEKFISDDTNYGLGVMGGINIKKFKIEVGYQYGLTNVLDASSSGYKLTGKLSSLFLGVSYVF